MEEGVREIEKWRKGGRKEDYSRRRKKEELQERIRDGGKNINGGKME